MEPIKLKDDIRKRLNAELKDIKMIEDDIRKAKDAMVNLPPEIEERCQECRARLESMKRVYFPNKV